MQSKRRSRKKLKTFGVIIFIATVISLLINMQISLNYLNDDLVKISENTVTAFNFAEQNTKSQTIKNAINSVNIGYSFLNSMGNFHLSLLAHDEPTTVIPVQNTGEVFSSSAFIGNSRTQGLELFAGMSGATFYTDKGLMVDTIFTNTVSTDLAGNACTIIDSLKEVMYQRIYIMLGVNELGWESDSVFLKNYTSLVEEIKKIQPQAEIYVQSIFPVSKEKSDTHDYLKNEKIEIYNALIKQMCTDLGVTYLDIAALLKDDNNALFSEATTDGIHLTKEYCLIWEDYLTNYDY